MDEATVYRLLDFEAAHANEGPLTRARAIRLVFGVSVARYYQDLNRVIERPEALRYAPSLTSRLLRLRDERRRARWPVPISGPVRSNEGASTTAGGSLVPSPKGGQP